VLAHQDKSGAVKVVFRAPSVAPFLRGNALPSRASVGVTTMRTRWTSRNGRRRNGRADKMSARPAAPKSAAKSASSSSGGQRTKTAKAATTTDVAGEPASRRALRSQGARPCRKLLDAAHDRLRPSWLLRRPRRRHRQGGPHLARDVSTCTSPTRRTSLRALVAEAGEVVADLDTALGPVGPDDQGWRELRRWNGTLLEAWQRYAPVLRAWTDLAMSDVELSARVMRRRERWLRPWPAASPRPGRSRVSIPTRPLKRSCHGRPLPLPAPVRR